MPASPLPPEMTPLPITQLWVSAFVQITEGMNTNVRLIFTYMHLRTKHVYYQKIGWIICTNYIYYQIIVISCKHL